LIPAVVFGGDVIRVGLSKEGWFDKFENLLFGRQNCPKNVRRRFSTVQFENERTKILGNRSSNTNLRVPCKARYLSASSVALRSAAELKRKKPKPASTTSEV
jgi:hypothetical protein